MNYSETTADTSKRASSSVRGFQAGTARVLVFESATDLTAAAAARAADLIIGAVQRKGHARVIAATGNSQKAFIDRLVLDNKVPWNRVTLFHMDEYVGISAAHPASFRLWIRTRIAGRVHPKETYYIEGDASDVNAEARRYENLLLSDEIDLAFVGIGENGHIAFNDPPVADFNDPKIVKRVALDDACKRQQAGEGHFENVEAVPNEALTITCPGLFRANAWITVVPDERKAEAVLGALEGPITTACPASIIRRHPNATVYLDRFSASRLNKNEGQ
ncbi:MAG TPA: glucosamine-6-phosphate deaminase [Bryobacteraceae bacterium]|jgi:glucosamine-6-phosphate deaminase